MKAGFIAVVGTVNLDTIVAVDGSRRESLGGILYNAIPLAALLERTGIRVRLFGRLGAEHREEAIRLLAPFPAADASALIADPAGTNLSRLDYSGTGDRREEVEMRVAPLTAADLAGAEDARAVLVNMISGRDVSRGTLADLRRRSRAEFLLDIQALARSFDSPRRPRRVPGWEEWSAIFDVVRGNEEEIAWFAGAPDEAGVAAERILRAGAGEVLATRGEKGSWRADLEEGGLRRLEIPPDPWKPAADPTGCGDSFLAGVCAGRVVGVDPVAAARLGSYTAARVAALSGLESLVGLRGIAAAAAARDPAWAALAGPG